MRGSRRLLAVLSALALGATGLLAPGAHAGTASLLTDGFFENSPPATYSAGQTFSAWTVDKGTVDVVHDYADTAFTVDLDGNEPGGFSQAVTDTAGVDYTVTFDVSVNTYCGPETTAFDVTWNGAPTGTASPMFQIDDSSWTAPVWERHVLHVSGTGSDTLGFSSADASGACGALISDVSLVAASATATTWDAVTEFSNAVNPVGDFNGNRAVWSYGYAPSVQNGVGDFVVPTDASTIVTHDTNEGGQNGGWAWWYSVAAGWWNGAVAAPVDVTTPAVNTATLDPGYVGMFINSNSAWSVLTWTSPISGSVDVAGSVTPIDSTPGGNGQWALLDVTAGGTNTLSAGTFVSGDTTASQPFSGPVSVAPGDKLVLLVGPGADGTYQYDYAEASFSVTQTSVTPPTVTPPSAPQSLQAAGNDGSVSLTWGAPLNNGGASVGDYLVNQYAGSSVSGTPTVIDTHSTALGATVPGLANGSAYTFTVQAVNSAGAGDASLPATATPAAPATPPAAPGAPVAAAVKGGATLTWADGADGGAPITDHRVLVFQVKTNHKGVTTTTLVSTIDTGSASTSATVTGLSSKSGYRFEVEAANSAGWSPASPLSNLVTPTRH